ncbi:MAG: helix-turn-helix transcriptional regulator [Gemmatimonas sp.]
MTVIRLRELRDAAGISQTVLAEATATTQRTISRLELGDNERVDLELLLRICEVLGVTMTDLVPLPRRARKR